MSVTVNPMMTRSFTPLLIAILSLAAVPLRADDPPLEGAPLRERPGHVDEKGNAVTNQPVVHPVQPRHERTPGLPPQQKPQQLESAKATPPVAPPVAPPVIQQAAPKAAPPV